jgi:hypothetical protein
VSFPPGCGHEEIVALVARFFAAFNQGDQAELARFFPEQATGAFNGDRTRFQVYGVIEGDPRAGGRRFAARDRTELLTYFAERHRQHERLHLLTLNVSGLSWHGGIDLTFTLTRAADDLPERRVEGKGAINCDNHTIFVWNMGNP